MKNICILLKTLCLLLTLLLLAGCGGTPGTETESDQSSKPVYIRSSTIKYRSVSEMMVHYNNVVTFEVLSTSVEIGKSVTGENYVTISKAKILDVFSGKLKKNQVINILQSGDNIHQTYQYIDESLGLYKKGLRYLGFLYEIGNSSEYMSSVHEKYNVCSYTGDFLINKKNEIVKFPSKYNIFPNAKTVDDIVKEIK